jgi:hypothetical protein
MADMSSLRAFADEYPQARLILLYRGEEKYRMGNVLCVPCDRFLRQIRPGAPISSHDF